MAARSSSTRIPYSFLSEIAGILEIEGISRTGGTRGKTTLGNAGWFITTCISGLTLPNVREEAMALFGVRRIVAFILGWITESISDPWVRQNVLGLGRVVLNLLAKHTDIRSQVFELISVFRPPDGAQ